MKVTVNCQFDRKDWQKLHPNKIQVTIPVTICFPLTDTLQLRIRYKNDSDWSSFYSGVDVENHRICFSPAYKILGYTFLHLIKNLIKYDPDEFDKLNVEEIQEFVICDDSEFRVFDEDQNYLEYKHREICLDEVTLRKMLLDLDKDARFDKYTKTGTSPLFDEAIRYHLNFKYNKED